MAPSEQEARWKQYLASKQGGTVSNQPKPKKKRKKKAKPSVVRGHKISKCCLEYAMATANPWCIMDGAVGIPDELPLPSFKFAARAKGVFEVGSGGFGYVAAAVFTPANGTDSSSICFAPIISTTASYPSAGYQYVQGAFSLAPGVVGAWLDSPFPLNQLQIHQNTPGSGISVRLVGAGIRARFVGSEFHRGGRAYAYRTPTNNSLVDAATATTVVIGVNAITRNKETSTVPVDREWHAALYRPALPEDLSYGEQDDIHIPTGGTYPRRLVTGPNLLFMVSGAEPGQTFEYDYVAHFEAIGPGLPGMTQTMSDPIGMAAVRSAQTTTQPTTNLRQSTENFLGGVKNALDNMTQIVRDNHEAITTGVAMGVHAMNLMG